MREEARVGSGEGRSSPKLNIACCSVYLDWISYLSCKAVHTFDRAHCCVSVYSLGLHVIYTGWVKEPDHFESV